MLDLSKSIQYLIVDGKKYKVSVQEVKKCLDCDESPLHKKQHCKAHHVQSKCSDCDRPSLGHKPVCQYHYYKAYYHTIIKPLATTLAPARKCLRCDSRAITSSAYCKEHKVKGKSFYYRIKRH